MSLDKLNRGMLKTILKNLIEATGYQVMRRSLSNIPSLRFENFIRRIDPKLVLDVGANVGQYALNLRKLGYSGSIISFEPTRDAFDNLSRQSQRDQKWRVENVAIGETSGEVKMQISKNSVSSSILTISHRHTQLWAESQTVGEESVQMCRLDDFRSEVEKYPSKKYLKIDTQGFELSVLRGASGILDQIDAIQLEASLVPLYEREAKIEDLIIFTRSAGFECWAIEAGALVNDTGQMVQVEMFFTRSESLVL